MIGALLVLIGLGVPSAIVLWFESGKTRAIAGAVDKLRDEMIAEVDRLCDASMVRLHNAIEYSGVHVSGVVCDRIEHAPPTACEFRTPALQCRAVTSDREHWCDYCRTHEGPFR